MHKVIDEPRAHVERSPDVLGRLLEVTLDAVREPTDADGLIAIARRPGQADGPVREVEGVPVPLEDLEVTRETAKNGIAPGCFRQEDRIEAELRRRSAVNLGPQRGCEELRPEAHSEERSPRPDGLADGALLANEPRILGLLIDPHRATHRDYQVVFLPVREADYLTDENTVDRNLPLCKDLAENCERIRLPVLQGKCSQDPSLAGVQPEFMPIPQSSRVARMRFPHASVTCVGGKVHFLVGDRPTVLGQ